jgi:hypothetical protein
MLFACWISRTADIHSEYVILIAFPQQRRFRGRASMSTLYIYWLSCVFLFRNSPEGTGCNAHECVSNGGVLPNRDWVTLLSECFMLLCSEVFSRYVKWVLIRWFQQRVNSKTERQENTKSVKLSLWTPRRCVGGVTCPDGLTSGRTE